MSLATPFPKIALRPVSLTAGIPYLLLFFGAIAIWLFVDNHGLKIGLLLVVGGILIVVALARSLHPKTDRFRNAMLAFANADYANAARSLVPLARQGHVRAQTNLGFLYAAGEGVRKDESEAVRWYRRAADQGYAPAQFNLAHMFADGRGCMQSHEQAASWYRKAAEQDFAYAQRSLGRLHEQGLGVEPSQETAMGWYYKAALGFHREAEADEAAATLATMERLDPRHSLVAQLRAVLNRT